MSYPVPAGRGEGVPGDILKRIGLRLLKFFFDFLTNTFFMDQSGALTYSLNHTARILYFTFTRLNLYLDLLSVMGFRLFIAQWKALNKRKQIAQLLRRIFLQIFAKMPLKRCWTFAVLLQYLQFSFNICSCPSIKILFLRFFQIFLHIWICRGKGFLKCNFIIIRTLFVFAHFLLNNLLLQ